MRRQFLLLTTFFLAIAHEMPAPYMLKNGHLIDVQDMATLPIDQHLALGMEALKQKNWQEAVHQFRILTTSFPGADLAKEGHYFLGVAYYHLGDADLANRNLSLYLVENEGGDHYLETLQYKLAIA